ncbi:hypothetical protein ACWEO4_47850, partial [Streptomyces sp. NPDC004393]
QSRLIYRPRIHLPLKGARKSFAWTDYRDLVVSALWQTGFRSRCAARVIFWTEVRMRPWA